MRTCVIMFVTIDLSMFSRLKVSELIFLKFLVNMMSIG